MNYYRAVTAGRRVGKACTTVGRVDRSVGVDDGDVDEERAVKCDVGIFISPAPAPGHRRLQVPSEDPYRFKSSLGRSLARSQTVETRVFAGDGFGLTEARLYGRKGSTDLVTMALRDTTSKDLPN